MTSFVKAKLVFNLLMLESRGFSEILLPERKECQTNYEYPVQDEGSTIEACPSFKYSRRQTYS